MKTHDVVLTTRFKFSKSATLKKTTRVLYPLIVSTTMTTDLCWRFNSKKEKEIPIIKQVGIGAILTGKLNTLR